MKKRLNRKKLIISKPHKRIVITVLTILILVNLGLIMNELIKENSIEETKVMSSLSNTPSISYQVFLKENVLYNNIVQPEDTGYFSNLIDHIEVTFSNNYQGANGAEYKGDYMITGEITGWESGTEEPVPAWVKQFNISPKKKFGTNKDELILSQSASINFNHFNNYIAQVEELTGYNATCTIKVVMLVNYTIITADGEVAGSLQPSLEIPLGESYFRIIKSGTEEVKNEITKAVMVAAPVDYVKISLFSAVSLFCLILLIPVMSSVEPSLNDLQRKLVKKYFKSHGSRLVAVSDNLANEALSICNVHSMNDMVKISDEIERPIFYVYQKDPEEVKEFFIVDREKAYLYKVPECQVAEKKKKDSGNPKVSAESDEDNTTVTA